MKKLTTLILLLTASIIFFNACDETTSPTTENPVITSLTYDAGYVGMELTINGSGFGKATDPGTVRFGGFDVPPNGYIEWTDTRIRVKIPDGAKSGKLVVINNNKPSNEVDFTIVPANPEPPTELLATSINSTTVRLVWKKSPQADYSIFSNYILTVSGGVPMNPITLPKSATQYDVTELEEGIIYTFEITSKYATAVEGTTSAKVQWSPASRFKEVNAQSIRIFESASASGSGLALFDPITGGPRTYTVAVGDKWEFGLYTTGGVVHFGPARKLPYNYSGTPKYSQIGAGEEYYLVNSLDEALDNIPMNQNITYTDNYRDLNAIDMKGKNAVVFLVRVENTPGKWNYAKVMIKKTGGQWLQGTQPNRYIEVEISYQKIVDVPFAKTPNS